MMILTSRHLLCLLLLPLLFSSARASHMAGGGMTYTYLGDSGVYHRYQVTLTIFEDCLNGQPTSIDQDNPAYFAVYKASAPYQFIFVDSALYSSSVPIPATMIGGPCGTLSPTEPICLTQKIFIFHIAVPSSPSGYIISNQRCCRNATVTNVSEPGNSGATYWCYIPGNMNNNSAVFNNLPPGEIAVNYPFTFNSSATDADGDSLSYELCAALNGPNGSNVKPWPPGGPPFDSITYIAPYTSGNQIAGSVPITINAKTGIVSGTPNRVGSYLFTVCCNEWRGGAIINTISREFEIVISSAEAGPYKPNAGGNITVVVGTAYQFHATGADSYSWSPGTYLSNTTIPDPVGVFTQTGVFTYTLHGTTAGGCSGDDVITVNVVGHSSYTVPNAFTPNGDGENDVLSPLPIGQSTLVSFKIFNRKGNLVYDEEGSVTRGWDGTYKGRKQDIGTYYWEVKYEDESKQSRLAKGDVTLIR